MSEQKRMAVAGGKPTSMRWFLVSIIFVACLIAYLDRVNLSICAPLIMEEMGLSKVELSFAMSIFFISYALMQIPGSMLIEKFGTRVIGAVAMTWWSVFTLLTPLAGGLYSFLAVRFLFGVGEGPLFPNNTSFISKWFNSKESGFSSSLMMTGTFLGPALGPPITVFIISISSWHWVFYAYGILGIMAAILWYAYSRNTPHEHRGVNEAELAVITGDKEAAFKKTAPQQKTPWRGFIRQPRFWCFGLQYFCANYIMYLFLSWIPLYLLEARGMSFTAMGGAAAMPWVCIAVVMLLCGYFGGKLIVRGVSRFASRALPGMIGMGICGVCLFMAVGASSAFENVVWLSISLGALGANYIASWAGCQDLGAQFGGSVAAWMNTFGTIGGVCAPIATAVLVELAGWDGALHCASVVILMGIVCLAFVKLDRPLIRDIDDYKPELLGEAVHA